MLRNVNKVFSGCVRKPYYSNSRVCYSKAKGGDLVKFDIDKEKTFTLYTPKNTEGFHGPNDHIHVSKKECLEMYRLMQLIRRFEVAADQEYKVRNIKGFCHLYDGQEAVCVGIEFACTKEDHQITAYRDHAHQIARGGTANHTMAELFGKATGCSKGKGGSMHMYLKSGNFYGGNGIVGAQVPVGAGLAMGIKYWADVVNKKEPQNVAFISYGDGAANQGQVFEAFNMSKLWNLPAIFVCEDNKYGMGTSVSRSSANTDYYTRGDYIPGIKVEGMDVFSVREAARYAKEWALKNGPIILHMSTYRYHGHSMSDPGVTYRTRDEIKEVRTTRDPINKMKERLLSSGAATENELSEIDASVKQEVDECVKFSKDSPLPPKEELATDVYLDKRYVIKGTSSFEHYVIEN